MALNIHLKFVFSYFVNRILGRKGSDNFKSIFNRKMDKNFINPILRGYLTNVCKWVGGAKIPSKRTLKPKGHWNTKFGMQVGVY